MLQISSKWADQLRFWWVASSFRWDLLLVCQWLAWAWYNCSSNWNPIHEVRKVITKVKGSEVAGICGVLAVIGLLVKLWLEASMLSWLSSDHSLIYVEGCGHPSLEGEMTLLGMKNDWGITLLDILVGEHTYSTLACRKDIKVTRNFMTGFSQTRKLTDWLACLEGVMDYLKTSV